LIIIEPQREGGEGGSKTHHIFLGKFSWWQVNPPEAFSWASENGQTMQPPLPIIV